MRANNVIRIPASLKGSFFKYWLLFLEPFHHLTDREIDVAAEFLRQRYELSKVISDASILEKVVMSEDTFIKIREACGLSLPHFRVIMGKLKKNKVLIDGKINPRFIPRINNGEDNFQLMLLFDLQNE
jgi:hypothetical protein